MSTIDQVSQEELQNFNDPVYGLSQLEKLRETVQAPNAKIQDIWACYRLLPMNPQYLIASHHRYERAGWSLMTKWQMNKELDKALREKNLPKLLPLIESVIATQKKIIALEKLLTGLTKSLTREKKIQAFQVLSKENPGLYEEIIHKIGVVYGRLTSQVKGEKVARESHLSDIGVDSTLTNDPINKDRKMQLLSQEEVVKKMIYLYKEGYPRIGNHFFTDIGK